MLKTKFTGKSWALLLVLLAPWQMLFADNRLALVIGNSNYQESPLSNPAHDAADMAKVLEELGFDVMLHTDVDRRAMARSIRDFGRELKKKRGVGLFYYAGHGLQIDNRNYLIPVNTPLQEEDEVPYESIDVGSVLAKMESAGNALNLLILDACRNNPFPKQFRSSSRGLARVDAPIGSLVVYATAPGEVAADGKGRNGVFTGHLIQNLRQTGLSLTQTIRRTRAAVVKETGGRQVPWESSSLLKEYYLSPAPNQNAPNSTNSAKISPAAANGDREILFWKSVQAGNTTAEYQAYLDNFPSGLFAALARARLNARQSGVTTPTTDVEIPVSASVTTANANQKNNANSVVLLTLPSGSAALTVKVVPDDSLVRIMNIVEKYRPGIHLERSREYDVLVTRRGYKPWRQQVALLNSEQLVNVTLEKQPIVLPDIMPIAGGKFKMGCSSGDRSCEKFEKPAHDVNVASFGITRTEITVAQFSSFVDSTGFVTDAEKNTDGLKGCYIWSETGGISRSTARWGWKSGKNWRDPGYQQADNFSVSCVSWNDAIAYARWLATVSGKSYRLPTEAEWEFAARAGSTTRYHHGNSTDKLCSYANGADKTTSPKGSKWSDKMSCSDRYWFSAPVATYKANSLGLHDMQGNVWEWVEDTWATSYRQTPINGTAYLNGKSDQRVLRGGAWDGAEKMLRLSSRSKGSISSRAAMTGFRLVTD